MPKIMNQIPFGFLKELDKDAAVRKKADDEYWKRQNTIAIHRSNCRDLPRTEYENRVIPHNVRLAHHVIDFECQGCELSYSDHALEGKFGVDPTPGHRGGHIPKICLKDWYCKGHGNLKKGGEV